MSAASDNVKQPAAEASPPGKGMFGWLGRQVGYVRRAVQLPVAHSASDSAMDSATNSATDSVGAKIYRSARVEEQTLPHLPNVKLRRTTIDELLIDGQEVADSENVTDRPPASHDT